MQSTPTALGHGPAVPAVAVQGHIHAHMIFGVHRLPLSTPRQRVIGREDTADEGNDGQGVPAVIADRIEIPPAITTRLDRLVESR